MGKTLLKSVVLEFQDDKDHSDWLHQIRTFVAPVSDAWNVLFILRDPYIHVHSLWEERWQCEIPLSTFHSYSKLRAFHGFPWFSMVFHCHVCRRISHPFPSWTAISRPQTRHHWAFLSKTDNPWLRAPLKTPQGSHKTRVNIWVCLKIGYIPNYSHLIGIMIIKPLGLGVHYFQTHPSDKNEKSLKIDLSGTIFGEILRNEHPWAEHRTRCLLPGSWHQSTRGETVVDHPSKQDVLIESFTSHQRQRIARSLKGIAGPWLGTWWEYLGTWELGAAIKSTTYFNHSSPKWAANQLLL